MPGFINRVFGASRSEAPAPGVLTYFSEDHQRCDKLWAALEDRLDQGDAAAAMPAWLAFRGAMDRHFAMEEEQLFPAFEEATGMHGGGPTMVMRMEHEQMRAVLDELGRALDAGEAQRALDQGDTLLMLIQQHNVKEEQMLYPMADQVLEQSWPDVKASLERYPA